VRWRREVIHRARLPRRARLLDLGTGTGDLAQEALRQRPDCNPIAADFTLQMMRFGQARLRETGVHLFWLGADALHLPFPELSFDAVVSGFLFRNVIDIPQTLSEQRRALKPGGRIVILDTTRPPQNLLTPFIRLNLRVIIPVLGRLVTGEGDAYNYLPDSTQAFLTAEQLAEHMRFAGFREVGFRRLMLGTIAIHWGVK